MILGIGIDTIEIERFAEWYTYSKKRLSRVFSSEEIEYCIAQPNKSAERFAVRFAAREALYKAVSYAYPACKIPFLTLCSAVIIKKHQAKPSIFIDQIDHFPIKSAKIHLSWSHSRNCATSLVIIERL